MSIIVTAGLSKSINTEPKIISDEYYGKAFHLTDSRNAASSVELLSKENDSDPNLINALYVAAGQASLLGQLAESQGSALSEPQLARLLEEALGRGVETTSFIEADGGPIRVRSLSEIDGTCDRLIWLGLGTGSQAPEDGFSLTAVP